MLEVLVAGKSAYVVRAAVLAVLATSGLACYLDRSGLNNIPGRDGGGAGAGGGAGTGEGGHGGGTVDAQPDAIEPDAQPEVRTDGKIEVAPDVRIDMRDDGPPPDVGRDVPPDMLPPCDTTGGFHRCGDTCVSNTSTQTCGSSCTPCAVPANGSATCNGTSCGIACNSGFTPVGMMCLSCDSSCDANATPVTGTGGRYTGKTMGGSNNSGSCGGAAAPEAVYKLTLAAPADVFITTHGTGFNTVLYVRRDSCCGGAEVACNDDADGRTTSVLSLPALLPGTYYIFVDGANAASAGSYTVDIFATPVSATPGDTCGRALRIADKPVSGDTTFFRDDYDPPATCTDQPNSSFDGVYYFVLDQPKTSVLFSTCNATCVDTVLYIRDVCNVADPMSACNDDGSCGMDPACGTNVRGIPSTLSTTVMSAGVHYLVIDTYPQPVPVLSGPYTITPQGLPP
jgi:hypothetical protein